MESKVVLPTGGPNPKDPISQEVLPRRRGVRMRCDVMVWGRRRRLCVWARV